VPLNVYPLAGKEAAGTAEAADLVLEPLDKNRLINLCGPLDRNLRLVEQHLDVQIHNRGNAFRLTGSARAVRLGGEVIRALYNASPSEAWSPEQVYLFMRGVEGSYDEPQPAEQADAAQLRIGAGIIEGKSANQRRYLHNMQHHDMNFGIGPAGTGKTYLAVAAAVAALERQRIRRIVLVRPAVEAGEHLGFLPGDVVQKVNPYLRPLYDALHTMLGADKVDRYTQRGIIEVAPLAFMRGRTLNESFVILDEAQNTTKDQMKMFLTRMGFGSAVVVTGDVTQIDLPRDTASGLVHAAEVLRACEGIAFTHFTADDAVRHPLVARILRCYQRHRT